MKWHLFIGITVIPFMGLWQLFDSGNPVQHHQPAVIATPKDSPLKATLFQEEDIDRMKDFFISNAGLEEQREGTNWSPGHRHKCINTVRAALDILLFGNSAIPDSLYSRHAVLNGNFLSNDVRELAHRLRDSNFIKSYDSIRFYSVRKGEWALIAKNDPISRGLPPIAMEKSLWNTLLARVGKERGFSVFLVSLCDGYHAAVLTLDHRNPAELKAYWADQTHRHPVRFFVNKKLQEMPNQYGWEVMEATGPDTVKSGMARGLDAYMTYANKKYWCDCGHADKKTGDCCAGNCYPFIQIWRVKRR